MFASYFVSVSCSFFLQMTDDPSCPTTIAASTAGSSQTTEGLTHCGSSDRTDNKQQSISFLTNAANNATMATEPSKKASPEGCRQSEDKSSGVEISAEEAIKGVPESEMTLAALKATIAASKESSATHSNPTSCTTSPRSIGAVSNAGMESTKESGVKILGSMDTRTSERSLPESDIDSSAPNSPGNGVGLTHTCILVYSGWVY